MKPEKELNKHDKKANITKKVVAVFAELVAVRSDDNVDCISVEIGSIADEISPDSVCNTFSFCDFVSINFNNKSPPQTSNIPPI